MRKRAKINKILVRKKEGVRMFSNDPGICVGSDMYYPTPSERARRLFYHVIVCGHFYCTSEYGLQRNDTASYLLFHIISGKLKIVVRGKHYIVPAGHAAFISSHEQREYSAVDAVEFEYVHFDGGQCAALYEEFYSTIGVMRPVAPDSIIPTVLSRLVSGYRNDQPESEAKTSAALYQCLCSLLAGHEDNLVGEVGNGQIRGALDFIKAHSAEKLTLQRIAEAANLSPYYFAHQFKRQTGYSPYEYTIICRINAAKHLLKTTDDSVKEIAFKVGYNSENAFTNSFTTKVGVSPRQFRAFRY